MSARAAARLAAKGAAVSGRLAWRAMKAVATKTPWRKIGAGVVAVAGAIETADAAGTIVRAMTGGER